MIISSLCMNDDMDSYLRSPLSCYHIRAPRYAWCVVSLTEDPRKKLSTIVIIEETLSQNTIESLGFPRTCMFCVATGLILLSSSTTPTPWICLDSSVRATKTSFFAWA